MDRCWLITKDFTERGGVGSITNYYACQVFIKLKDFNLILCNIYGSKVVNSQLFNSIKGPMKLHFTYNIQMNNTAQIRQ